MTPNDDDDDCVSVRGVRTIAMFYFWRCIHFAFEPVSIKTHSFFHLFSLPFFTYTYTLLLRIFHFYSHCLCSEIRHNARELLNAVHCGEEKNQFKRGNCKKNRALNIAISCLMCFVRRHFTFFTLIYLGAVHSNQHPNQQQKEFVHFCTCLSMNSPAPLTAPKKYNEINAHKRQATIQCRNFIAFLIFIVVARITWEIWIILNKKISWKNDCEWKKNARNSKT